MSLNDLTRDAVLAAIYECQTLGRDAFLRQYGFHTSRSYFLDYEGIAYDSKAIAGVAHGYLPGLERLKSSDFSEGKGTVEPVLKRLGFTVKSWNDYTPEQQVRIIGTTDKDEAEPSKRNQKWSRDELILALDLYVQNPVSPPGKTSREVAELSEVLNQLRRVLGVAGDDKFRNVNGVYMKLMNFRRFDPQFQAAGKAGLKRVGKDEERVWDEFASNHIRLKSAAEAIRVTLSAADAVHELTETNYEPYIVEAEEGALLTRVHQTRERNRKLILEKKKAVKAKTGALRCEACDFDFFKAYGERGKDIIDVHHIVPLHTSKFGTKTSLDDLALVCANCHRIIHAQKKWLTVAEVRALLTRA